MILGQAGQTLPPLLPSRMPRPNSIDLTSRRLSSLMNVLVFSPYAIYIARGKMPPPWLIAASLVWTGINFFDDMRYLIQGEQTIEGQLGALPPCGCAGLGCANGCNQQNRPPGRIQSFPAAQGYRVNR